MRKTLVILALMAMGAACFAGAPSNEEEHRPPELDCVTKGELDAVWGKLERKLADANQRISEANKKEAVREVAAPKPKPSNGFAVGFHGSVPTIVYDGRWYDVEVGYSSVNSDPRGIAKAGLVWASDHKDYTVLKTGIALLQDNGTQIGWYVGCEQYVEKSISVTGDVYLVTSGENRTDLLTATIGGRLYLWK